MKVRLTGPLGSLMKRHLQLCRSLGYELRTAEIALDQFDAYAADLFPESQTVTRPMITGYLQKIRTCIPLRGIVSCRSFGSSAASCFNSIPRITSPKAVCFRQRSPISSHTSTQ